MRTLVTLICGGLICATCGYAEARQPRYGQTDFSYSNDPDGADGADGELLCKILG